MFFKFIITFETGTKGGRENEFTSKFHSYVENSIVAYELSLSDLKKVC